MFHLGPRISEDRHCPFFTVYALFHHCHILVQLSYEYNSQRVVFFNYKTFFFLFYKNLQPYPQHQISPLSPVLLVPYGFHGCLFPHPLFILISLKLSEASMEAMWVCDHQNDLIARRHEVKLDAQDLASKFSFRNSQRKRSPKLVEIKPFLL